MLVAGNTMAQTSNSWELPIDTGEVPNDNSTFDAIVVGGGPGGSSAAGYLAMAGKSVLLLEKGVWPRDKICGDAVGGKSLSHVKALGVKNNLEQLNQQNEFQYLQHHQNTPQHCANIHDILRNSEYC